MAEPDQKRGRLEELLDSEQVRQLFIYGGKEVILNLDVMEVVFLYQALPHIRNRLKKEHVWNLLYNEKLVPQLLELGIEPKRLGDDDRQNCLAWAFALKMYRMEVSAETSIPSKWYVTGDMRSQEAPRGTRISFERNGRFFTVKFINPLSHTRMRAEVVRALFEETLNNPTFSSSQTISDYIRTSWEVAGASSAIQQLAQVIYIFLNEGFSMVVQWHNGTDVFRPKEFRIRDKL